jgi:hypothetical protein
MVAMAGGGGEKRRVVRNNGTGVRLKKSRALDAGATAEAMELWLNRRRRAGGDASMQSAAANRRIGHAVDGMEEGKAVGSLTCKPAGKGAIF